MRSEGGALVIAGGESADGRSAACPLHSGRLMAVSQVLRGGFAAGLAPQRLLPGSRLSVTRRRW